MTVTDARPFAARSSLRRRRAPPIPATGCVGIVTGVEADRYLVASGDAVLSGRRAVSCLLEPVVGDTVSCVQFAPDELWLVAILMREDGAAHTLRLRGDTTVQVDDGRLSLHAPTIELQGENLTLAARKLAASVDEGEVVGREFRVIGSGIKLVAALIDTVADRVTQFSKHYQRHTQGVDRVRAQVLDQEATQLLAQTAEHVTVNGRRLVKTRGGQIQFG